MLYQFLKGKDSRDFKIAVCDYKNTVRHDPFLLFIANILFSYFCSKFLTNLRINRHNDRHITPHIIYVVSPHPPNHWSRVHNSTISPSNTQSCCTYGVSTIRPPVSYSAYSPSAHQLHSQHSFIRQLHSQYSFIINPSAP